MTVLKTEHYKHNFMCNLHKQAKIIAICRLS